MGFKQLSKWEKWYLKYTDREAYITYKEKLRQWREDERFRQQFLEAQTWFKSHPYKTLTSFRHSGNAGDVIYSLPAVYALAKNGEANLYLHINQPADYSDQFHPMGDVMLTERMAQMLLPLLRHQPQIAAAEIHNDQPYDYDLDEFRRHKFPLDRGSIVRWYFNVYGVTYNSSLPWLTAPVDEQYKHTLVIARSHRYRSPVVDYGFLKRYPNTLFVGVKEEYEDMKASIPDLLHKPVNDFLELATIINSCKLFIGNQSFPFSLAEALKAKRLLEVFYKIPNVVVEGEGGNDFMYQPQFEHAVERLMAE